MPGTHPGSHIGGGFAAPTQTGGTLGDGTLVSEIFDEIRDLLYKSGYTQKWNDGWQRDTDGAIVTCGYTYRQVRIRRFRPGHDHQTRKADAIHDIVKGEHLDQVFEFVASGVEEWSSQDWKTVLV